jgi:hypothetical protein
MKKILMALCIAVFGVVFVHPNEVWCDGESDKGEEVTDENAVVDEDSDKVDNKEKKGGHKKKKGKKSKKSKHKHKNKE